MATKTLEARFEHLSMKDGKDGKNGKDENESSSNGSHHTKQKVLLQVKITVYPRPLR